MAHITMHHFPKLFNLFHNNLVMFINMNFSFYKSINLKINQSRVPK